MAPDRTRGDYSLQSEWVARANQPGFTFDGEAIWPGVLACHAGVHAGAVKLATGSWLLAGLEFAAHPRSTTRVAAGG